MAIVSLPALNQGDNPDAARRVIGPALLAAVIVELLLIGGAVWVASRQTAETVPPLPPAIQLDLTTLPPPPKPAPPKPAPQPPQPPKPAVKPIPHPVPVHHHVAAPRPKPVAPTPPPLSAAPSPFAEKPTPPPPPAPTPPAEASPQISDIFEAQIRAAIQAAQQDPNAGRMIRLTGDTTIEFTYLDGAITNVEIVQSSGHDLLDNSALAAVHDAQLPTPPQALLGHALRMRITIYNHDQE